MLDLLIIGAGPAGITAAYEAKQHGLSYLVIEKGLLGNTVYNYPVGLTCPNPHTNQSSGSPRFDRSTRKLDAEMRQLCQQQGVTYLSPYATLCDSDVCFMRAEQDIESRMQFHVSHLTVRGSDFLVSRPGPDQGAGGPM